MDCASCREQLDLYVLEPLDAPDAMAVEQHLASCSDCRGEAARTRELLVAFADPLLEDVGQASRRVRLRERLHSEIAGARRRERFGRRAAVWARAAAFAAVAALFVLAIRVLGPGLERRERAGPRWRYPGVSLCSEEGAAYPLVRGDKVVAFEGAEADKHVVALEKGTGDLAWRTPFAVIGCSLAGDERHAYTWRPDAAGSTELVALDLETGRVVWRHAPTAPTPKHAHLVALGDGVCWAGDGRLAVLGARTGRLRWAKRAGEGRGSSLSAGPGGTLVVASETRLSALRADDGTVQWEVPAAAVGGRPVAPLVRVDGDVLVVAQRRLAGQTVLCSYDARSGRLRWQRRVRLPVHSLTLAGDVYVRSTDVHAFDSTTGRRRWSAPVGGCSPVVAASGQLYAVEGRDSPVILALDPATGARTWQQSLASSCSGLVVVGATGFLSARDGSLYALGVHPSSPFARPGRDRPYPVCRAPADPGRPEPSA